MKDFNIDDTLILTDLEMNEIKGGDGVIIEDLIQE